MDCQWTRYRWHYIPHLLLSGCLWHSFFCFFEWRKWSLLLFDRYIDCCVNISGGPVVDCDRKHSFNHCCCGREVQLRSTHPPICPHTEGQCCLLKDLGIIWLGEKSTCNIICNMFACVVRVGRSRATPWGRNCSVWLVRSVERLALKRQLERYNGESIVLSRRRTLWSNCKNGESLCCVCICRCWRCCGSWLISPPYPPVWSSRRWRNTWEFWATPMQSRRLWSAVTSLNVSRTLRRWDACYRCSVLCMWAGIRCSVLHEVLPGSAPKWS